MLRSCALREARQDQRTTRHRLEEATENSLRSSSDASRPEMASLALLWLTDSRGPWRDSGTSTRRRRAHCVCNLFRFLAGCEGDNRRSNSKWQHCPSKCGICHPKQRDQGLTAPTMLFGNRCLSASLCGSLVAHMVVVSLVEELETLSGRCS